MQNRRRWRHKAQRGERFFERSFDVLVVAGPVYQSLGVVYDIFIRSFDRRYLFAWRKSDILVNKSLATHRTITVDW